MRETDDSIAPHGPAATPEQPRSPVAAPVAGAAASGTIEIRKLECWYGPFRAVRDVSLSIPAQAVTAIIVEGGTRVILAAHWIERIGDRVTNIAEDVVYLATGQVEDLNP